MRKREREWENEIKERREKRIETRRTETGDRCNWKPFSFLHFVRLTICWFNHLDCPTVESFSWHQSKRMFDTWPRRRHRRHRRLTPGSQTRSGGTRDTTGLVGDPLTRSRQDPPAPYWTGTLDRDDGLDSLCVWLQSQGRNHKNPGQLDKFQIGHPSRSVSPVLKSSRVLNLHLIW